jgi:hypothetical protein
MEKLGPAIFCVAILCVGALFIFPAWGPRFYFVGLLVTGAAWLGWLIYSLLHRRWSAVLVLIIAILLAMLLLPAIARQ